MATTDTTTDTVESSDVTAPYVLEIVVSFL